ncbi:hypothetical protein Tco_1074604, partial [Tanacetum coccineum]
MSRIYKALLHPTALLEYPTRDFTMSTRSLQAEKTVYTSLTWTLGGNGCESFWEEGDNFGLDVLRFHTCLNNILGFLEKFGWWFEQDIGGESEDNREKKLVMVYSFGKIGVQVWTFMRRVLTDSRDDIGQGEDGLRMKKSWNETILHHFHQQCRPADEIRMDDLEWC